MEQSATPRSDKLGGYIYFIETVDGRFVKIGFSVDPYRRLSQLGTLRPGEFELRILGWIPGTFETERWLHDKFVAARENGEWFTSTPELRTFIKAVGLLTSEETPDDPNTNAPQFDQGKTCRYPSGFWRRTNYRERHFVTNAGTVGKLQRGPSERNWTAMVKDRMGKVYRVIGERTKEVSARALVERTLLHAPEKDLTLT